MRNIVDIKNRIKSIKKTSNITRAMQLISVSKLRRANEKYLKNLTYYNSVKSVLKDILKHTEGELKHPYLKHRETQRTVYVVIASDNGMAGDYNHRVLNFALQKVKAASDSYVFTIGQMAREFFVRNGIEPDVEFLFCAQDPTLDDARRITADLVDLYDENHIDEVHIIHTVSENNVNVAKDERLLPIEREDFSDATDVNQYSELLEFEPSRKEVFDILVPQYVLGQTYTALIQAVRCEHTERIATMSNASKNADEMIDTLELQYFRARQEQITTELAEISGGNAAKI